MDATAPGNRRDAPDRSHVAERVRASHRGPAAGSGDRVELTFPNDDRFSSLTRMTGAALASAAGFSVAEIDVLRRALDRAWAILHEAAPADHVMHIGFDAIDHQLRFAGCGAPPTPEADTSAGAVVELELTWRSAAADRS